MHAGDALANREAAAGGFSLHARNRAEGTIMQKMESEQLERLRHANQDLLEKLKAKQEEIKKRLPRKPLSASALSRRTTPAERAVPVPKRGKENQVHVRKGTTDPVTLLSVEPGARAARAALRSPLKPAECGREGRGAPHRRAGAHPGSPRAERSFTSAASVTRETSIVARDGNARRSPEEESTPVKHGESRKQSTVLHSAQERGRPGVETETMRGRTTAEGNGRRRVAVRDSRTPKSILLTPGGKEAKKEAGRVTFLSDPEEYTIPAASWSARPFLGYDWIAGLLETDSSLSEKSEQYFSELREFRQVNKEACVHEEDLGPEAPDYLAPEQEADLVFSSHQCVYCYRLNRRLFTVPVDSQSACPVCKTPRARRPPETLEEPAYVRVSIPRSTLLPAYKYKIHRRKSFEPADDLALPSHCLAGWENIVPSSSPTLSSLDLRASLEQKPTDRSHLTLASRISGGTRTDQLLDLSRSAHFRLSNASQQRAQGDQLFHWNNWQPWVCMCELHKQARIRHFVVSAENITVNLQAGEFWQEKACSLLDCIMCKPEECPGSPRLSGFLPQFEHLSVSKPSNANPPPMSDAEFESYESLPVVDDMGEK